MTIKEGRNRQLRRVLASLGHKVRDLKRIRLGPIKLQQLPRKRQPAAHAARDRRAARRDPPALPPPTSVRRRAQSR